MDEPASALDPIATQRIEELMYELKTRVHDRHRDAQHAAGGPRVRQDGFFQRRQSTTPATGRAILVEFDSTSTLFTNPTDPRTEAYVTGRFGLLGRLRGHRNPPHQRWAVQGSNL